MSMYSDIPPQDQYLNMLHKTNIFSCALLITTLDFLEMFMEGAELHCQVTANGERDILAKPHGIESLVLFVAICRLI